MDGDPQPRWYAEIRYAQLKRQFPGLNPEDGPHGESYWWKRVGNMCLIAMNVSRVWRTWNINNQRGKFTGFNAELNNPDEWGFGDNAVPVMANPEATIFFEAADGQTPWKQRFNGQFANELAGANPRWNPANYARSGAPPRPRDRHAHGVQPDDGKGKPAAHDAVP